ncbi:hypothetical protein NBH00_12725 [Paraconexibacter antarcticus]|uniref:Uncharacterized protein n=1 Tax=Paraconexibacter antarcticus TaxID=2949664 RepID=A0ABY5DN46_9ACTN|nr:hypothetical protein [Paraconexibacter antarcticus]UTI62232.1 hypothetical protein NBH00_12725 [Paraconexibacter antarcticus]
MILNRDTAYRDVLEALAEGPIKDLFEERHALESNPTPDALASMTRHLAECQTYLSSVVAPKVELLAAVKLVAAASQQYEERWKAGRAAQAIEGTVDA